MAFSEDQTDLFLTLRDGVVLEVPRNRAGGFQRAEFVEQFLPIPGVQNILEEETGRDSRGDREMSTDLLADSARAAEVRSREKLAEMKADMVYATRRALGWQVDGDSLVPQTPEFAGENELIVEGYGDGPVPPDEVTRAALMNIRTNAQLAESLRLSAIAKRVEIHKKWSISFACIVFVLLGAPLAVRFPRGGVGMVISVSIMIFAVFWACLIGGEALADDGHVSPWLAMWFPNLILFPLGIVMIGRISTQVATARGGGWDDLWFTLSSGLKRPFRRFAGGVKT
jgi:lipopolysaccharide export system permease protein